MGRKERAKCIRLLAVDDESIICQGILVFIDFGGLGMTELFKAENRSNGSVHAELAKALEEHLSGAGYSLGAMAKELGDSRSSGHSVQKAFRLEFQRLFSRPREHGKYVRFSYSILKNPLQSN